MVGDAGEAPSSAQGCLFLACSIQWGCGQAGTGVLYRQWLFQQRRSCPLQAPQTQIKLEVQVCKKMLRQLTRSAEFVRFATLVTQLGQTLFRTDCVQLYVVASVFSKGWWSALYTAASGICSPVGYARASPVAGSTAVMVSPP
jgi:hypothetical protein